MFVDGAELKSGNGSMDGVNVDLVITSNGVADSRSVVTPTSSSHCDAKTLAARRNGVADSRSVVTPTSSSHCDAKTLAARRKRLEIRRLRFMTANGNFTDPPPKRPKVNGTVVCEVKAEVGPAAVEVATLSSAMTGDIFMLKHTSVGGVMAPVRVEVRPQLNLCVESLATEDLVRQRNIEKSSGHAQLVEVGDINRDRAAGSSDGVSRTACGDLGGLVVNGKREGVERKIVLRAGWTREEAERRVGSVEWWRRSDERPPPELWCPDYGAVSVCGRRREMEDAAVVVPGFFSLPVAAGKKELGRNPDGDGAESFHFFGVYDGHGGAQVAEHCKERLHVALAEEMKVAAAVAVGGGSRVEAQWEAALVASFRRVDAELGGICTREPACMIGEGQTLCCVGPLAPGTVGSTAVVAVVGGGRIVVGNCGDSRAVLCRGGRAIPLSRDHKPGRPDEMARIEAAGGRVIAWNGYRVLGVLAMSRAIGDRYLKPYVIAVPEITSTACSDEDECLILASDGLWDVLPNDVVCDVTRRYLAGSRSNRHSKFVESEESPAEAAAALLTKLALAKNSRDNISVVVVDLKAFPQ